MPLPVIHNASFHEYELRGCPLLSIAGLECVALWRVAEMLGCDRKEAARLLGLVHAEPGQAPAVEPAQTGPLFEGDDA